MAFNIFSLSLNFDTSIIICLCVGFFGFTLFERFWASWIWMSASLSKLGRFSAIISQITFLLPPLSLFLLGALWWKYFWGYPLSPISYLHIFSFCYLDCISYTAWSLSWMILSSASSTLLWDSYSILFTSVILSTLGLLFDTFYIFTLSWVDLCGFIIQPCPRLFTSQISVPVQQPITFLIAPSSWGSATTHKCPKGEDLST